MCFRPPQVGKPIKCPECGAMNPFNQAKCKKCKAELPHPEEEMMKCPQCGALNLPGSDVCDECGLTMADALAMKGPAVPPAPPKAPGAPIPPVAPKVPKG